MKAGLSIFPVHECMHAVIHDCIDVVRAYARTYGAILLRMLRLMRLHNPQQNGAMAFTTSMKPGMNVADSCGTMLLLAPARVAILEQRTRTTPQRDSVAPSTPRTGVFLPVLSRIRFINSTVRESYRQGGPHDKHEAPGAVW